jgi:hypothetical protein
MPEQADSGSPDRFHSQLDEHEALRISGQWQNEPATKGARLGFPNLAIG